MAGIINVYVSTMQPILSTLSTFINMSIRVYVLGSSSAIANMIAGLVITYMRPFRINDRIKSGEITGDVVLMYFSLDRKVPKGQGCTHFARK